MIYAQKPLTPPGRVGLRTGLMLLAQPLLDGLLIGGLLLLTFLFGCFKQKDADIWWHLKTGRLILERGDVPRSDWFTFTSATSPWIDLHWLFQMGASKLYAVGGMELLSAMSAAMGTLAVAIQIFARYPGAAVTPTVAVWWAFLFLLSGRLYVRPEVVTLICLSSFLAILLRAERRPGWWLAALVPIQLLWVNVQGLFILGLILAGVHWIDGVWRSVWRQPDARVTVRTILLLSLVAVSLLNPYRLDGLMFPFELFRKMSWDSKFYSERISELQSISQFVSQSGYRQFYVMVHFGLLGLAIISFCFTWWVGRFSAFRTLVFAIFAWLSFQATRNSGQVALVAGAVTAWNFGEWFAARREKRMNTLGGDEIHPLLLSPLIAGGGDERAPRSVRREGRTDEDSALAARTDGKAVGGAGWAAAMVGRAVLVAIILITSWTVISGRFYAFAGEGRLFGLGEHPLWHAHAAAQFAAQPGMPDRMLAFHLGQAAVFDFHMRKDQRTFADPRLEVVSRDILGEYHAIEAAIAQDRPGWREKLREYGLEMILVDHESHSAIDATLLSAADWRCVYFDPVAAVFLSRDARIELDLWPVDFASALRMGDDQFTNGEGPGADYAEHAGEPDPRIREAAALYRIAGSLLSRQVFDLQLARSMLLLAARHNSAAATSSNSQFELDRLRGQIFFALHSLTGRAPGADEMENFTWDSAALLDLARARYFLERARQQMPADFSTLAHLYEVAKVQVDLDAQRKFGDALVRASARNAAQREVRRSVSEELQSIPELSAGSGDAAQNSRGDIAGVRRLTGEYLAAKRPQAALELLRSYRQHVRRLPWDLAQRLADLSMFLGAPGFELEEESIDGEFDKATLLARRGSAQLVMGFLRASIDANQAVIELDPNNLEACFGLARAHLERGDAASARAYCLRALEMTANNNEIRHQLEWMSDLARP